MRINSYDGKNVTAIFAQERFIYRVDGVLELIDESHVGDQSVLQFKNATLYASGIMLGDVKAGVSFVDTMSGLRLIGEGKRLNIDKKDLVTIMEIESS